MSSEPLKRRGQLTADNRQGPVDGCIELLAQGALQPFNSRAKLLKRMEPISRGLQPLLKLLPKTLHLVPKLVVAPFHCQRADARQLRGLSRRRALPLLLQIVRATTKVPEPHLGSRGPPVVCAPK